MKFQRPPPQVPEEGVASTALGALVVVVVVPDPTLLISLAVVWSPAASTIENVNGSTQEPLVVALKEPPATLTIELTKVTDAGNVDVTRYGGVPP